MINEIDVQELSRLRESGESHTLVDIRSPMEILQGSIANAENIPMNQIPEHIAKLKELDKVVLYCRSGARSAHACAFLASQGLDNVINLKGGIIAWSQSGQPVA